MAMHMVLPVMNWLAGLGRHLCGHLGMLRFWVKFVLVFQSHNMFPFQLDFLLSLLKAVLATT